MIKRVFPVEREPDLFYEDMYMKCTIYFESVLDEDKRLRLNKLIESWVELGFFQAMPAPSLLEIPREDIFRTGGLKYFGGLRFGDLGGSMTIASFVVDLGYLDEAWVDILLNCLECYHGRVARIYLVKLTKIR